MAPDTPDIQTGPKPTSQPASQPASSPASAPAPRRQPKVIPPTPKYAVTDGEGAAEQKSDEHTEVEGQSDQVETTGDDAQEGML